MADRSAVGKELPSFVWKVESGKIFEFVRAIGDTNPIYVDKDIARKAGYKDTPAPLSFPISFVMWTNVLWESFKVAGIPFDRVLHGEETYEYYQEIYPDDVLTGSIKIISIDSKVNGRGSEIDIVRLEILYSNQANEKVIKVNTVLVERK